MLDIPVRNGVRVEQIEHVGKADQPTTLFKVRPPLMLVSLPLLAPCHCLFPAPAALLLC